MAADSWIALLRAVNLAGKNGVAMSDLRDLAAHLDFEDPRTLLNSGNLVFRATARGADALERTLEKEAARRLGVAIEFFVRSADEWTTVIEQNPFRKEAKADPGHLLVVALKDAPDGAALKALQAAIAGREVVRAVGRHAYIVYPDGVGRSRLTSALIEKKLGTRGTGRNWNTVLKLRELATVPGASAEDRPHSPRS